MLREVPDTRSTSDVEGRVRRVLNFAKLGRVGHVRNLPMSSAPPGSNFVIFNWFLFKQELVFGKIPCLARAQLPWLSTRRARPNLAKLSTRRARPQLAKLSTRLSSQPA